MHFANTLHTVGCGREPIRGMRTTNFDEVTCPECRQRGPRYGIDASIRSGSEEA